LPVAAERATAAAATASNAETYDDEDDKGGGPAEELARRGVWRKVRLSPARRRGGKGEGTKDFGEEILPTTTLAWLASPGLFGSTATSRAPSPKQ